MFYHYFRYRSILEHFIENFASHRNTLYDKVYKNTAEIHEADGRVSAKDPISPTLDHQRDAKNGHHR